MRSIIIIFSMLLWVISVPVTILVMIVQLAIENANVIYQYVDGNKPSVTATEKLKTFEEKLATRMAMSKEQREQAAKDRLKNR